MPYLIWEEAQKYAKEKVSVDNIEHLIKILDILENL